MRNARYKLIHFYDFGQWELFDLEKDPRELHSLHNDPEYRSIQEELKRELGRLRDQYRVPEVDPDRAAGYPREEGSNAIGNWPRSLFGHKQPE